MSETASLPCRQHPVDLWFADDPAEVEHAKRLCQGCAQRRRCLSTALQRHEPWGVWGGQLLQSGRVVPRKRPRGRPRRTDSIPVADAPSPESTGRLRKGERHPLR
ncbi:MAG: WhiB family transcriptional regulator [Intrasporangium sp.]|uniref:WhiB family transcriptional regulator n=1 Tax=Intrasporangium sp. TaxID=1925024 RepID=UPI00264D45AE|nr:WhiB family transcriptional regulator [Intrasporangium sp.]